VSLRAWSWKKKLAAGTGGLFLLLLLLVVIGYVVTPIPEVQASAGGQASIIRYADGSELGRIGTQNRRLVPLSQVSDPTQKAVLAAEDRGFYTEPGISPKGIARAFVTNLKGGGVQQGGSTITQQYAKNAFLTQDRTYSRKIKEFFISLKLSQQLSKNQILENYLNTIYFGRGALGVEVAARTYFGVPAAQLTAAQGAVLAATIRSPAAYDPSRHRALAEARWNYVLDGMVKKGWLSESERAGMTYPAVIDPSKTKTATGSGAGPTSFIIDRVEAELAKHGLTDVQLATGGYSVTTTIRRQAQVSARSAVENAVPDPKGDRTAPVAALVSVDPRNGEVWAYYGGRTDGGFDYAGGPNGVQPGSTFKAFTLAAALEQGIGLGTQVDGSSPQTFGSQTVSNDVGDPPFGYIDLVTAMQYSVNTAFYNLVKEVGPQKVADLAHAAGIPDNVNLYAPGENGDKPTLGITLGIYNVHVMDMASAYGTFANGGVHAQAHFVKAVTVGGKDFYTARTATTRAFSQEVAADTSAAMQAVVQGGTGTRAQLAGRPAAGKTGTTEENRGAWFSGFTPQLSTAVWLGRPDNSPLKGVLGSSGGVYGATIPARIWKDYTDGALQGQPVLDFPPRANIGNSGSLGNTRTRAPSPTSTVASPSASPSASVVPSSPPASPVPSAVPSDVPTAVPSDVAPASPPASVAASPAAGG
jgi:membrane peptidoglycan carboxypeptidase